MNTAFYLAKKILAGKRGKTLSNPVINIAIWSVALSLAVMLVAVLSVSGFKKEITNKVCGFAGDIIIKNFDNNDSYLMNPIHRDSVPVAALSKFANIAHLSAFAIKPGIIKSGDDLQGIVLKGCDSDYQPDFITTSLVKGKLPTFDSAVSNEVVISETIANQMKLEIGSQVLFYFVEQPPRVRKWAVAAIYNTGLEEFDNNYVMCDIRHIQKLNNWEQGEIGGYEVFVKDKDRIAETTTAIYNKTGNTLVAESITQRFPQLFSWLNLINSNVTIILVLMIIIACVNMIAALLILILDNTPTIGILQSLGAGRTTIAGMFATIAAYLIGVGLLLGNVIGLGLAFIQKHFNIVKLSKKDYYLDTAPIDFDLTYILMVNLGTFVISFLFLLLPVWWVSRMKAINAIRFE
ncbi:MAG: FtsX-like permease family protein [Bacteroidetes bacterium]|nr:FtsX-like permease family protein [Bacteroidota bacterium]